MKEIIKTLIRFSCNVIKLSEIFCKTPRTESSQILVRGVLFFFYPFFTPPGSFSSRYFVIAASTMNVFEMPVRLQ